MLYCFLETQLIIAYLLTDFLKEIFIRISSFQVTNYYDINLLKIISKLKSNT